MGDFVLDVESHVKEVEALSHNEFFARRWWQLECLDYQPEIELCLLSIEDLVERVKQSDRILIDIRAFKKYQECHMKGSFHMNQRLLNVYVEQQRAQEALDHLNMMNPMATETNSTTSASDHSSSGEITEASMSQIYTYIDFL